MPKLNDYICNVCEHRWEHLKMASSEVVTCPACCDKDVSAQLGGHRLEVIVPAYRGSLKVKAGSVHSHGDRPATKTQISVPLKIAS